VAQLFGVLRSDGKSERAIFIIDKNCIIRYVDVHDIDDQPDNEVLFRELARIENVPVPLPIVVGESTSEDTSAIGAQPELAAVATKERKVVMYCTQWCPGCRRARAYFKQHNIEFEEIDIGIDREAAARVRSWANGNETTPTFDVNGKIVINFKLGELNKLLGIQE